MMESHDMIVAIRSSIPDADIAIDGEGCSFSMRVVSGSFSGLTQVKRQQRVLASLARWLETGALHAVSLKTLTPDEAQAAPLLTFTPGLVSLSKP